MVTKWRKKNVLGFVEHLSWRTGKHLHVFHVLHVTHVLQTYSMFSHPGLQDGTISAALRRGL